MEPQPTAVCLPDPDHRFRRRADGQALLGAKSAISLPHALHRRLKDPAVGQPAVRGDSNPAVARVYGRVSVQRWNEAVPSSGERLFLLSDLSVGRPHSEVPALPGTEHASTSRV